MFKQFIFFVFCMFNLYSTITWSDPSTLSSGSADQPQVVINSSGKAIAIWVEAGRIKVLHSTDSGLTWIPASPITLSNPSETSASPQIAINSSGQAIAVWGVGDGSGNGGVRESHLQDGTWSSFSWSPSSTLDTGINGVNPQIALNDSGNAMALWGVVNVGFTRSVNYSKFSFGGSWDPLITLAGPSTSNLIFSNNIALNNSDEAIGMFYFVSSLNVPTIEERYGTFLTGLTSTNSFSLSAPAPISLKMKLNDNSIAIMTWSNINGPIFTVDERNSSDAGANWTPIPQILSDNSSVAINLDLALSADGEASVVWTGTFSSTSLVQENHSLDNGNTWLAIPNVNLLDTGSSSSVRVVINSLGRIIAAWVNGTVINERYSEDFGTTWTPLLTDSPFPLEPNSSAGSLGMAMNEGGKAIALWELNFNSLIERHTAIPTPPTPSIGFPVNLIPLR